MAKLWPSFDLFAFKQHQRYKGLKSPFFFGVKNLSNPYKHSVSIFLRSFDELKIFNYSDDFSQRE